MITSFSVLHLDSVLICRLEALPGMISYARG